MAWLQITLETNPQLVEQIAEGLNDIGALSVTFQDAADQPVYEPTLNTTPLWERTLVTGLFAGDTDSTQLLLELQAILSPLSLPPYRLEIIAEQEWTRVCMADFHAMQFGQRLWICPSWQAPPDPNAVNILLDPGLAFGTGTHATTALCLEWLDQQHADLHNKTIVDYGCGSGILAIAAAKLGATQIWAIDNDPQALRATQDNAQNNQVATQIFIGPPEQLPTMQFDGLLANILANPLIELAATFANTLKTGGFFVLSGILKEQANDIIMAYTPYFAQFQLVERDNWLRISAIKQHCSN